MTERIEATPIGWIVDEAAEARQTHIGIRVTTVALVVLCLVTLWTFSVPGTYFMPLIFLPWVWPVVFLVWFAFAARSLKASLRAPRRHPWVVIGLAIVVSTPAAITLNLPLHARFQLSREPLQQLVVVMTAPDAPDMTEEGSFGLFDAEWIERFDGGFRFLVKGTGFLNPYGFAYSPNGQPPDIGGEDYYEHFTGPWWIWEEDW